MDIPKCGVDIPVICVSLSSICQNGSFEFHRGRRCGNFKRLGVQLRSLCMPQIRCSATGQEVQTHLDGSSEISCLKFGVGSLFEHGGPFNYSS